MRNRLVIAIILLTLLLVPACGDPESGGGGPSNTNKVTDGTASEWHLIACAFIDTNGNGEVDAADERLLGGQLQVDLAVGAGFGGVTDQDGCAAATLPGSPGDEAGFYPILMQMLAPTGSRYRHVTPEVVTLVYPDTSASFLFAMGE